VRIAYTSSPGTNFTASITMSTLKNTVSGEDQGDLRGLADAEYR